MSVIPLYADTDLLDEAGVTEVLRPGRPSFAPKRRRGLFRRR
jgi:hypothetical protein